MLERAPARPEPPPADVEEALPDWLTSDEVEPEPEQKPEPEGRSDAAVLARRDRIAWLALAAIGGLMLLMVAVALVVLMTSG